MMGFPWLPSGTHIAVQATHSPSSKLSCAALNNKAVTNKVPSNFYRSCYIDVFEQPYAHKDKAYNVPS